MNARVEERVDNWGTRPFSGGHAGLRELADEEFTGVVDTVDGTWLCLLNGKVVGLFGGRMDGLADAEGTAYVAPDPALPLLFAMWEQGGTQEDRYYTKDTPISEADATLSSGGFAGYIELSDNVLSGDYYVCYYGDRSMSVAFVGANRRLLTDDEAFERADDEIGIYDVYSVDLEVTEIPAPENGSAVAGGGTTADPAPSPDGTAGSRANPPTDGSPESTASDARPEGAPQDPDPRPGAEGHGTPPGEAGNPGPTGERASPGDSPTEEGAAETNSPDPAADPPAGPADDARDPAGASDAASGGRGPDRGGAASSAGEEPLAGGPGPDDASASSEPRGGPDPVENDAVGNEADSTSGTAPRTDERSPERSGADAARSGEDRSPAEEGATTPDEDATAAGTADGDDAPRSRQGTTSSPGEEDRLRQRVRQQASTIDRLQERLSALETDREDRRVRSDRLSDRIEEVAGDLAELRRTVMRLDRTVERLEADADRESPPASDPSDTEPPEGGTSPTPATSSTPSPAESGAADRAPAGDGRALSVEDALRETTVLVRYGSQGKSTLKTAHGGGADAAEVNDNLQLTAHTSFDDSAATVEGRPYSEFLRDRLEYRFFEWLLRELLYEIRDTGNQDALADLYDAIPRIDRAEFSGTVELGEAAEEESVRFDLVARDDRDRPLVAMNFQESREPATEGMVVELQDRAKGVCEAAGLSAAFLVTTSYFDGAAKDAAEAATSGRILSRSSKESFVRVNRKQGFHLCLAAVSEGDFHLRTPEL